MGKGWGILVSLWGRGGDTPYSDVYSFMGMVKYWYTYGGGVSGDITLCN